MLLFTVCRLPSAVCRQVRLPPGQSKELGDKKPTGSDNDERRALAAGTHASRDGLKGTRSCTVLPFVVLCKAYVYVYNVVWSILSLFKMLCQVQSESTCIMPSRLQISYHYTLFESSPASESRPAYASRFDRRCPGKELTDEQKKKALAHGHDHDDHKRPVSRSEGGGGGGDGGSGGVGGGGGGGGAGVSVRSGGSVGSGGSLGLLDSSKGNDKGGESKQDKEEDEEDEEEDKRTSSTEKAPARTLEQKGYQKMGAGSSRSNRRPG